MRSAPLHPGDLGIVNFQAGSPPAHGGYTQVGHRGNFPWNSWGAFSTGASAAVKLLERFGCSQTSRLAACSPAPGLLLLLLLLRLAPVRSITGGTSALSPAAELPKEPQVDSRQL